MSFVDSICVKFLNASLLIYGKGNKLIVQNEKITDICGIKPYDKIHNISYFNENNNSYKIACSAGREILVAEVCGEKFRSGFLTKFSDWISSIKYLDNGLIAIITSHNVAGLLEIQNNQLVLKEKVKCANNSTLYCSYISGNLWTSLNFFSGTALGELIIWNKNDGTVYQESTHNGVIFSIHCETDRVITSSDDRSIKIYQAENDFSKLTQLKQLFGHTSRVFVGKIIHYKDEIKYLSAGEDSNLCIWTENGILQSKKNISASGIIWNLDYDEKNSVIITSSSTGKLNRFELDKIFYEVHEEVALPGEPSKLIYLQNGALCALDNNIQIYTRKNKRDWQKCYWTIKSHQKIVSMDTVENRLVLASKNSILIFDYSKIDEKLIFTSEMSINEKFSGKLPQELDYIRAVHLLSKNEVLLSDVFGSCLLIDLANEAVKNLFKIPKSSEPWSTSIARFNDYWLIADRCGSLFLYHNKETDLTEFHSPIHKVPKLHGLTGVTSITVMSDELIRTTGNDGTIKTLRLDRQKEKMEFHQLERTHVHFIEKIRTYKGQTYVYGFNDNYFVVYRDREIIFEHRCGGRHRHWDVNNLVDDSKIQFSYIYKKQIHCVEFYLNDFKLDRLDIDWHVKPCNFLVIDDSTDIMVTGGEDTILKVSKINKNTQKLTKIADINSHISSIKSIIKIHEGNDLLIISLGGRAQIVVTRLINLKYVKEEINFLLTNSMLCGRAKESTFDPETRFICAFFDAKRGYLYVGCSDGYLRVFQLISSSLKLLIESFYGRCILNITMIKDCILTMATDGVVCFWLFDVAEHQVKIIHKLQHNKNGINCFDIWTDDSECFKIATAGDDTAICVTNFEIIESSAIKCCETIKSSEIHIAQVTGIKFMRNDQLLTASVDQTVCKVDIKSNGFEIVDKRSTCIADVKGFKIYDKKFIFVHGAGLEAIEYF